MFKAKDPNNLARKSQLKKIQPHHLKSMRMRLDGYTYKKIAEEIGRSPTTIQSWFLIDKLFQDEYSQLKDSYMKQARDILSGALPKSAQVLKDCLDLELEKHAANVRGAATDIMDRSGIPKQSGQDITSKGEPVGIILLPAIHHKDKEDN